jgi:methylthioribose-1-phosphate isomerase
LQVEVFFIVFKNGRLPVRHGYSKFEPMRIQGNHYRTIWEAPERPGVVQVIHQGRLPHAFEIIDLISVEDFRRAIADMQIRGAGLIGATAAYGMVAAVRQATGEDDSTLRVGFRVQGSGFRDSNICHFSLIQESADKLLRTRPTAVNLAWAVQQQLDVISACGTPGEWLEATLKVARKIADDDAAACQRIGELTLPLIQKISAAKQGKPVNILTHCNAGWLAFVDYGTATAGIYAAHEAGIPVHVWVDETRPRNQGASLTAWELAEQGVPHHLIADNTGGHLMQHGMVDLVIVGADRVTRRGDAANKIGTYLKALAAKDNNIPFYVALPSSTFDLAMDDGIAEIPVEERGAEEVREMTGVLADGTLATVRICPETTPACNYGFDVTPARLITGLICEHGICDANEPAITALLKKGSVFRPATK